METKCACTCGVPVFSFPLACPLLGDVLPFLAGVPFVPLTPGLAAVVPGFFATGLAAALPASFCGVVLGAVFAAGDAFFGGISFKYILSR